MSDLGSVDTAAAMTWHWQCCRECGAMLEDVAEEGRPLLWCPRCGEVNQ